MRYRQLPCHRLLTLPLGECPTTGSAQRNSQDLPATKVVTWALQQPRCLIRRVHTHSNLKLPQCKLRCFALMIVMDCSSQDCRNVGYRWKGQGAMLPKKDFVVYTHCSRRAGMSMWPELPPASQYNVTKHMHSNKRRKLVSTGIVTAVLNVALLRVTMGAV